MLRRLLVSLALLPLLLALAPAVARADDAGDELFKAWQAFLALKSFRAEITVLEPGRSVTQLEFQAPDRYRVSIPNGPTSVVIGDSGYMEIGGRIMKLPIATESLTSSYRDEAFLRRLQEGMAVEDLGEDSLDGEPVRKFRYVQAVAPPSAMSGAPAAASGGSEATTVAWVSTKSRLILRLDVTSQHGGQPIHSEIRYSDFNSSAIRILPPE
ncbi:hypothetical protein [Arenimonas sp.]|uniref:hypothetical protein n=1 Tax=Arenimonas sp. TaxID=1872635 RepID=UPI002E33178F|nr:hypothetical protein [Arenimonas sp.]HEX4854071.1 hypothetical protein [Arenimonas sp.]